MTTTVVNREHTTKKIYGHANRAIEEEGGTKQEYEYEYEYEYEEEEEEEAEEEEGEEKQEEQEKKKEEKKTKTNEQNKKQKEDEDDEEEEDEDEDEEKEEEEDNKYLEGAEEDHTLMKSQALQPWISAGARDAHQMYFFQEDQAGCEWLWTLLAQVG